MNLREASFYESNCAYSGNDSVLIRDEAGSCHGDCVFCCCGSCNDCGQRCGLGSLKYGEPCRTFDGSAIKRYYTRIKESPFEPIKLEHRLFVAGSEEEKVREEAIRRLLEKKKSNALKVMAVGKTIGAKEELKKRHGKHEHGGNKQIRKRKTDKDSKRPHVRKNMKSKSGRRGAKRPDNGRKTLQQAVNRRGNQQKGLKVKNEQGNENKKTKSEELEPRVKEKTHTEKVKHRGSNKEKSFKAGYVYEQNLEDEDEQEQNLEDEDEQEQNLEDEDEEELNFEDEDEQELNVEDEDEQELNFEDEDDHGMNIEDEDDHGMNVEDEDDHGMNIEDEDDHGMNVEDEDDHGMNVEDEDDHGMNVEDEDDHGMNVEDEDDHGMNVEDASVHEKIIETDRVPDFRAKIAFEAIHENESDLETNLETDSVYEQSLDDDRVYKPSFVEDKSYKPSHEIFHKTKPKVEIVHGPSVEDEEVHGINFEDESVEETTIEEESVEAPVFKAKNSYEAVQEDESDNGSDSEQNLDDDKIFKQSLKGEIDPSPKSIKVYEPSAEVKFGYEPKSKAKGIFKPSSKAKKVFKPSFQVESFYEESPKVKETTDDFIAHKKKEAFPESKKTDGSDEQQKLVSKQKVEIKKPKKVVKKNTIPEVPNKKKTALENVNKKKSKAEIYDEKKEKKKEKFTLTSFKNRFFRNLCNEGSDSEERPNDKSKEKEVKKRLQGKRLDFMSLSAYKRKKIQEVKKRDEEDNDSLDAYYTFISNRPSSPWELLPDNGTRDGGIFEKSRDFGSPYFRDAQKIGEESLEALRSVIGCDLKSLNRLAHLLGPTRAGLGVEKNENEILKPTKTMSKVSKETFRNRRFFDLENQSESLRLPLHQKKQSLDVLPTQRQHLGRLDEKISTHETGSHLSNTLRSAGVVQSYANGCKGGKKKKKKNLYPKLNLKKEIEIRETVLAEEYEKLEKKEKKLLEVQRLLRSVHDKRSL